jgi:hypothetical protein
MGRLRAAGRLRVHLLSGESYMEQVEDVAIEWVR